MRLTMKEEYSSGSGKQERRVPRLKGGSCSSGEDELPAERLTLSCMRQWELEVEDVESRRTRRRPSASLSALQTERLELAVERLHLHDPRPVSALCKCCVLSSRAQAFAIPVVQDAHQPAAAPAAALKPQPVAQPRHTHRQRWHSRVSTKVIM